MRSTRQRDVILEELCSVRTHPTADEVYEMSRKRIPGISLATVYRNLERMADLGVVTRIDAGTGKRRYDGDVSPHHHSRCPICGRVFDLSPEESMRVEGAIGDLRSMDDVDGVDIELRRVCSECFSRSA